MGEREGRAKQEGGGPGGGEVERGSGGVREEKKGRESRKSMGPQDDARGLLPKMTWDTLEQVTGGVTTDFTVGFRLSLSVLPAVPSWMEIITSIYKLNYKGIYMVPNKILIAVH